MSKPDQLDEPSMEEILASIRKAIDEDTRFGANAASKTVTPAEAASATSAVQLAEDVLGLTRGNRGEARSEARRATPRVALVTDATQGVLRPAFGQARDETMVVSASVAGNVPLEVSASDDEVAVAETTCGSIEMGQADGGEADMAMERSKFEHSHSGEHHPGSPSSEPAAQSGGATVKLADVDAVVSSAFEKLSAQLADSRRRTTPTLEDLAKELMRPVIKEWLDENLSGIVERMVQAEIERVTRRNGL